MEINHTLVSAIADGTPQPTASDWNAAHESRGADTWYMVEDDFMDGRGTTATAIGNSSFTGVTNATMSITRNFGTLSEGNPGFARVNTASSSGNAASLQYNPDGTNGSLIPADIDEFSAIVMIPTITSVSVQIGLTDGYTSASAANGVYFRFEPGTNSGRWEAITRASSSGSPQDTGVAVSATEWDVLHAWRSGSDWKMQVNNGTILTFSSDLPTAAVFFALAVVTNTGTARNLDVDYTSLLFKFSGVRY